MNISLKLSSSSAFNFFQHSVINPLTELQKKVLLIAAAALTLLAAYYLYTRCWVKRKDVDETPSKEEVKKQTKVPNKEQVVDVLVDEKETPAKDADVAASEPEMQAEAEAPIAEEQADIKLKPAGEGFFQHLIAKTKETSVKAADVAASEPQTEVEAPVAEENVEIAQTDVDTQKEMLAAKIQASEERMAKAVAEMKEAEAKTEAEQAALKAAFLQEWETKSEISKKLGELSLLTHDVVSCLSSVTFVLTQPTSANIEKLVTEIVENTDQPYQKLCDQVAQFKTYASSQDIDPTFIDKQLQEADKVQRDAHQQILAAIAKLVEKAAEAVVKEAEEGEKRALKLRDEAKQYLNNMATTPLFHKYGAVLLYRNFNFYRSALEKLKEESQEVAKGNDFQSIEKAIKIMDGVQPHIDDQKQRAQKTADKVQEYAQELSMAEMHQTYQIRMAKEVNSLQDEAAKADALLNTEEYDKLQGAVKTKTAAVQAAPDDQKAAAREELKKAMEELDELLEGLPEMFNTGTIWNWKQKEWRQQLRDEKIITDDHDRAITAIVSQSRWSFFEVFALAEEALKTGS